MKTQARLVHFGSSDTILSEELWVGLGISGSLIYAYLLRKAVKSKIHILLVILDTTNDAKVKKRYINQNY